MIAAGAYIPREVVHELRQAAYQQYGRDTTTDEDLDGTTELKLEYRAAILLDRQADRIELLEATLRSIAAGPGKDEAERLAAGALEYAADRVPNVYTSEDGDVAWVQVTPITETPEQVIAALKANGVWTVDDGTVYGYEVGYRAWMVPCADGDDDLPLLTQQAVQEADAHAEIVYFELEAHEGCETGSWWWHCDGMTVEPEPAS